VFWLLFLAGFFAIFVAMVWRVSAGPSNEEPALGHNLPGSSTTLGQIGVFPLIPGAELGTPESLVSGDSELELRRAEHRRHWDEEQRHKADLQ